MAVKWQITTLGIYGCRQYALSQIIAINSEAVKSMGTTSQFRNAIKSITFWGPLNQSTVLGGALQGRKLFSKDDPAMTMPLFPHCQ